MSAREDERAGWLGGLGLSWAGRLGCLVFLFKTFFLFFSAKQTKQIQNKAKFIQTNFLEFVKLGQVEN